jgi:Phage protein (N4 Gp49/phage Sf6 gene 66) family
MNDKELDAAIAERPYPKVTKEGIQEKIKAVDYMVLHNSTVTICNINLANGYSVRGESACVDSRNFDMQIGRDLAYRDAFSKIWPLEGYLLAEKKAA